MKSTDKVLIGIVSGIVLLVVVAFSVAMLRPKQAYLPDDTPEGVAFNYLFALQQGDYEKAHDYLSPSMKGYPPTQEKFASDLRTYSWVFDRLMNSSVAIEVISTKPRGERADVEMRETRFYENGLFDSGESTQTFTMTVVKRPDGAWKVENSEEYWLWCWNQNSGCK